MSDLIDLVVDKHGGLIVPIRRRVLLRRDDNTAIQESAAILLDIADVHLSPKESRWPPI